MNEDPPRPTKGYWHWRPYRPAFRWPLRIVGFLGISACLVDLVKKHSMNWETFVLSLGFAMTSFQTPVRRFRVCEARPGPLNLLFCATLVLVIAGGVYLWFRFAA